MPRPHRHSHARSRTVARDAAAREAHDPVGALGEREVVRHEDERGARVAVELLHHPDDAAPGLLVEVAGRLVGEEDLRPVRERARERDPLLLAAGKLGGIMVEALPEADPAEQRCGALAGAVVVAPELERHQHVLERGQRRQEVERLEDEADVRRPKPGPAILGKSEDVLAVQDHPTSARLVEPRQKAEKGRLAAPRRADDGQERLRGHLEIDFAQHG
jgi:hypothetical protein